MIDDGRVVAYGTPAAIKAELVDEYVLVDADDRAALLGELGRLGLPHSGDGPVRIPLDGRRTHQILRAIETPLTVVQTHTPSLEDAIIAAMFGAFMVAGTALFVRAERNR